MFQFGDEVSDALWSNLDYKDANCFGSLLSKAVGSGNMLLWGKKPDEFKSLSFNIVSDMQCSSLS